MAWLATHKTISTHPKIFKLSRRLNVSRACAIGHLLCLWFWCLQNRPDGDLTGLTCEDISHAAEWKGEPNLFLKTLIEANLVDDDWPNLAIHNWSKYRKGNGPRWVPDSVRLDLWLRDGWSCVNCGASCGDLQVDHVMPRSRGGPDSLHNYQWLCGWCNRAKGSLLPEDWSKISNRAALASPCRPRSSSDEYKNPVQPYLPDCGHDPNPVQQRIAAVS